MFYFSYGSNMSVKRLQQRITADRVGVAFLQKYRLKFHKFGQIDQSGKCHIEETDDLNDLVFGVVFEISELESEKLDRIEGVGSGYEKKIILINLDGRLQGAMTYYATNINPSLKPLNWYKEHVLRGARENQLPESYIQQIEAVESIADPDQSRQEQELSIYRYC